MALTSLRIPLTLSSCFFTQFKYYHDMAISLNWRLYFQINVYIWSFNYIEVHRSPCFPNESTYLYLLPWLHWNISISAHFWALSDHTCFYSKFTNFQCSYWYPFIYTITNPAFSLVFVGGTLLYYVHGIRFLNATFETCTFNWNQFMLISKHVLSTWFKISVKLACFSMSK